MDFVTTGLLALLTYVGVFLIKETFPSMDSRLKPILALLIGVGVAFLVAASDFASSVQVFGFNLDAVNSYSVVIAGLLVGAAAVGFNVIANKAIPNIGANNEKTSPD